MWQKRWLCLDTKTLSYSRERGGPIKAVFSLVQGLEAKYCPRKRTGLRFNVSIKGGRTIAFEAKDVLSARGWVDDIQEAVAKALAEEKSSMTPRSILSELDFQCSPFMISFFEAKFGLDALCIKELGRDAKLMLLEIKRNFPSNHAVLVYLLSTIIDPGKGLFFMDLDLGMEDTKNDEPPLEPPLTLSPRNKHLEEAPPPDTYTPSLPSKLIFTQASLDTALQASQRYCDEKGCRTKVFGGLLKCKQHTPTGAAPEKALQAPIIQFLHSTDTIRELTTLFETVEPDMHGLALRVLYAIYRGTVNRKEAAEKFASRVEVHCSGVHFSKEIKDALFFMLLRSPSQVVGDLSVLARVDFRCTVVQPEMFRTICFALRETEFSLRAETLGDLYCTLKDNLPFVNVLTRYPQWQFWLLSLLTDVVRDPTWTPAKKGKHEAPWAVVVQSVMLVLVTVLEVTIKEASVQQNEQILEDLMVQLHEFGGNASSCSSFAARLWSTLTVVLTALNEIRNRDPDSLRIWTNIFVVMRFMRKFVFRTGYWQTRPNRLVDGEPVEEEEPELESFFLVRRPPDRIERHWDELQEVTDYGIHWASDDTPADLTMIDSTAALFRHFKLNECDFSLYPEITKEEKAFMSEAYRESGFWDDAREFVQLVKRQDIEQGKLTYRRLSLFTQSFLEAAGPEERANVIKDTKRVVAKGE